MLGGDLHTQLVTAGARLARAGLVCGPEGNLSARLGGRRCLLTPTGGLTGRLTGADLVEVGIDGAGVSPRASSEFRMHLEIYRRRPDVGAIAHAHPPTVLRLAALGRLPDPSALDQDERIFGRVIEVDYAEEGSRELATSVGAALDDAVACVLREHGAVTVGDTVETALRRMLWLERCAVRSRGL